MKKLSRCWQCVVTVLVLASFSAGCVTRQGSVLPSSHFTYPNSNVESLGTEVKAKSGTMFSILVPRSLKRKHVVNMLDKAMAQALEADTILNCHVDTRVTTILLLFYFTRGSVSGTAARMEIGEQELVDRLELMQY